MDEVSGENLTRDMGGKRGIGRRVRTPSIFLRDESESCLRCERMRSELGEERVCNAGVREVEARVAGRNRLEVRDLKADIV